MIKKFTGKCGFYYNTSALKLNLCCHHSNYHNIKENFCANLLIWNQQCQADCECQQGCRLLTPRTYGNKPLCKQERIDRFVGVFQLCSASYRNIKPQGRDSQKLGTRLVTGNLQNLLQRSLSFSAKTPTSTSITNVSAFNH